MTNVSSFHKLHMFLAFYEFALKLSVTWSRSEWLDPQTRWAMLKWHHRFFLASNRLSGTRVFAARWRTETNVFPTRESRFSSRFRAGIGSSYVGTDGLARTVDGAQIYLYSCANSPAIAGRANGLWKARTEGEGCRCACHLWMSLCNTEPRLDMRDGETVKYTAQYFAGARFVAVSPKLTRNSNCYMRHRAPRIYVDTRWYEKKNYQPGITERVAVGCIRK